MNVNTNNQSNSGSRRLGGLLLITISGLLFGCEAMQGVNVGASVPIGGVVGVGVNKTIGDGQSKTPSKQQKTQEQEESEQAEEETSE